MAKDISKLPVRYQAEPQYTIDDLYFSVFNERRKFDEEGNVYYVPLDKNTAPTGVKVFDNFLNYLNEGRSGVNVFCHMAGVSIKDFRGLCMILTGMNPVIFQMRWTEHAVLELLRYSNLSLEEVTKLSGAGSQKNMCETWTRASGYSPWYYRYNEREKGDVGKYRV